MLFEFERRGFVERKDDKLVLLYRQIPLASFPEAGLKVLSNDLCSTIDAVEENLFRPAPITNLHLRTEFDRIAPRFVPTIRRWLLDEGKEFHRKARNFLAQFDKDLNPEMAKEEGEIEVSVTASSYTPPAKEWS